MRFGGFGTRPTRAELDQAARLASQHSPAVQAEGNLAMMRWDATGAMERVRCPVMVFVGGRDLVTRPDAGEAIAAQNPAIELVRVPAAGHMGPVECADFYNDRILAFADRAFTAEAVWADRLQDQARTAKPSEPERSQRPDERPAPRH
jgi:pimeloyl-ACP methyl ester carboxylesterase